MHIGWRLLFILLGILWMLALLFGTHMFPKPLLRVLIPLIASFSVASLVTGCGFEGPFSTVLFAFCLGASWTLLSVQDMLGALQVNDSTGMWFFITLSLLGLVVSSSTKK